MPLQITARRAEDVPSASSTGKVNADLAVLKDEMKKLATGMILQIETYPEKGVRSTKGLITKATRELGTQWSHWHVGSTVYAQPDEPSKRRGRPRKPD